MAVRLDLVYEFGTTPTILDDVDRWRIEESGVLTIWQNAIALDGSAGYRKIAYSPHYWQRVREVG